MGFPGSMSGKELTCQRRRLKRPSFNPWIRKIPGEGPMATHSNILGGKFIGKRSLVGFSP